MALRIAILASGDQGLAHGRPIDALAVGGVEEAIAGIESSCRRRGWNVTRVTADRDPARTLEHLRHVEPDLVFQLAETVGGDARLEAAVAWLLEWAKIPYTGSGPRAITLALEKPLARAVLAAAGVPIPRGFVLETADAALPIELGSGRWIVKPSREDASHGIDLESVVTGAASLRERAAQVIADYRQPALVEQFIDGREFNVSILGSEGDASVLPLGEIDFSAFPAGKPKLVTYAAKWIETSAECAGTLSVAAGPMEPALEQRVHAVALAAYHAIGLAGYGRVDIRVSASHGPLVLDVNPNPDISPGSGLVRAAARGGLDHEQLIARIAEDALRRSARAASAG